MAPRLRVAWWHQNELLHHVEVFALISSGTRIFQATLSMKAPNVPSEFWPGGKSIERPELAALMSGLGVQMVLHAVIEHLPIHQAVKDGVMSVLVDQRAGILSLKLPRSFFTTILSGTRLCRAGHSFGINLSRSAFHLGPVGRPFRRRHVERQHDVEHLAEIVYILPPGSACPAALVRWEGRQIQRDRSAARKSKPRCRFSSLTSSIRAP